MQNIKMANASWRGTLPALAVFEAASRHLNFSRAARELGMTQPAVSQQIAWLEAELACPLFQRQHRGVELTPEGVILREAAVRSRNAIESAQAELRARSGQHLLTIATDYGFAGEWLIPQLGSLTEAALAVQVRIIASQSGAVPPEATDFTIRLGTGAWPRRASTLLFRETVYAVASPAFLARHVPVESAAALAALPLLHLVSGEQSPWLNWQGWFDAHGITRTAAAGDFFFNTYSMVQQAALAGQGVALGWRPLADIAVQAGRLVPVLTLPVRSSAGYFLIEDPDRTCSAAASGFRDWLISLCQKAAVQDYGQAVPR